uniref:non-specific serine/threonine protein kinase n=1 Tax=Neogobius melanostomus TaxID=47308 RepID=A0A8C6SBW7_9GOBI
MERTATLAKGCFGKVYKEKYNDKWAAIKRVPLGLISRKDLERECEVYKKSEHPNIVKLLGPVTLKAGKYVIPMEFIFGEDLETTIFKVSKSKIPLTPAAKTTIIVGMCEGLLHLHLRDIVHQDLKPDNIMVEHDTNRAVIIDLGLAKFFKNGLNSAIDMGNEAYAAPEVLQRGIQRDPRTDVWAMGKIIAELCARVRLVTPSVNPDKIKDTLKDSPYCRAVCRMVQPDPSLRATMAGVIGMIRVAGFEKTKPAGTGGARDLTPPAKPADTSGSRDLTPPAKPAGTGGTHHLAPPAMVANAGNRSPTPMNRAGSPYNRVHSPFNRDPSPMRNPINRSPTPLNWEHNPRPEVRRPPPQHPLIASPPNNQDRSPSPLNWRGRPEIQRPTPHHHVTPSPPRNQDQVKALLPKSDPPEISPGLLMRMQLHEKAARDFPCDLPTTGRVVIRRFEEKEGQVGTWEQKEVVTRDGKIIKYIQT